MPAKVEVKHAARLAAHLSMQREHGKYCDVCVCVGEKRFLAHKCVLSANSTKLDCLILEAIGQNSSTQDIEIEIQGVSSLGFETLLEHFYTGELNLSPQTVMPVWMTAAYLELPGVVAMCNDFCQRSVTCVSNQSSSDDGNKIQASDSNDINSSGASITSTASSNGTLPPNTVAMQLPTKRQQPVEVASTKYSQMTTVTPTIKTEGPGSPDLSTTSQHEKISSSDENGIVSWTSLQTATGDDFQSSNTTITEQDYDQYQSSSSAWSQSQQTWPVQTYQNVPSETYTVSNTGELIKSEALEDGEIPVHSDDTRIIPVRPQHSEGVSFIHNISPLPAASTHQGLSIVDVNKLSDIKSEKPGCENIMLEVERLRIQHQQLQRLQQQQASLNNSTAYGGSPSVQLQVPPSYGQPQSLGVDEPVKKKAKKKKPTDTSDVAATKNDPVSIALSSSSIPMQQAHVYNMPLPSAAQTNYVDPSPISRTTPPADFKYVTEEYREVLYKKFPVKPEQPMSATCTAQELLQRGKSRKRKSTEHNALNNTIRLILDTLEITESSDARVEDALILIMDRFQSLRASINDPAIRRSLLVKVRHSIHCKKWRVKRQILKAEKMEELGITSTDEYNKLMKQESTEDSLHGQGIESVRSDGSDPSYSSGGSLFQKSPPNMFETVITSEPI